MPSATILPQAIDLSHHLNTVARSRHPSPLKDLLKYMGEADMLSLAGGLPHPSLFPFLSLKAEIYPSDTFLDAENPSSCMDIESQSVYVHKSGKAGDIKLDGALQYSSANGLPQLRDFAHEFTKTYLSPAYANFDILVHSGNTDGWCKIVNLLAEDGDYFFIEEHTYPSSQAQWIPRGCKGVPLKMDSQGIMPTHLKEVLDGWEARMPGQKKPHVLYTVPVGQNPTGTTMGLERKKDIYDIAVAHDLIIVEDDPYYFLQYSDYVPNTPPTASTSPADYLKRLVPSFLSVDYQGRVIRLETFSKTLAPGSRLGYFVCNPLFSERLLRATEVDTQTASGFAQSIIASTLQTWGQQGFVHWLSNLCEQYRVRRDWLLEGFYKSFDCEASVDTATGLKGTIGRFRDGSGDVKSTPRISFVCPTAGMFVFVQVMLEGMPRYTELLADSSVEDADEALMQELWRALIAKKTLLVPGGYYKPWQGKEVVEQPKGYGHFRFAYSIASRDELGLAVARFESVLKEYWGVTDKVDYPPTVL